MAHAPRQMIACRSANDKRTAPRSARRAVTQLDLFGAPRRRPLTPEKLTSIALGVWGASGPVVGPGAAFFRSRRLPIPDAQTVRYHPSLKCGDERAPGLVWLLREVRTDQPCGVLRVYLDADGWAVSKKVLGRCWGATLNRAPRPP
jgi:hypothetical protein